MIIKYVCEICGASFNEKENCKEHELTHTLPNSKEKFVLLSKQQNDPEIVCRNCVHSYWVYGCEFDCKFYFKECNARLNWPKWKYGSNEERD